MPRLFTLLQAALAAAIAFNLAQGVSAHAGEERAILGIFETIARESRLSERELEAILVERYNVRLSEGLRDRASRELGASLEQARSISELEALAPELQSLVAAELAGDGVLAARAGVDAAALRSYGLARERFLAEDGAVRAGNAAAERSLMAGTRGNPVSEELARQALASDLSFREATGLPLLGEGCESIGDPEAMRALRDLSDSMASRARGLGPGASPAALDEALEAAARETLGERAGKVWEERLCRLILVCRVFDGAFGRTRCP